MAIGEEKSVAGVSTISERESIVKELRITAGELLRSGEVKVVIGYGEGYSSGKIMPVFITDTAETDKLVFDSRCVHNLSMYLKRPEIKALGKPAIVAKGCDVRAINVLLLEQQVKREEIVILGVVCDGVGDPQEERCASCLVNTPTEYDHLFGSPIPNRGWNDETFTKVEEIEKLSQKERWAFWLRHFDRCIKCYACREACPICTCTRCITDKNQPQWVPTSSHSMGKFHWNLTRAFHLAGRCVGCNECERACPVDIPLSLINGKLIKAVHDDFEFIAGMNSEDQPPMATYTENEEQEFIK